MNQSAVVSQQQQPFAVCIQPSSRVHVAHRKQISERRAASRIRELTQHAVWFIQEKIACAAPDFWRSLGESNHSPLMR